MTLVLEDDGAGGPGREAPMRWEVVWSSDDPRCDGSGTSAVVTDEGLRLPGEAAIVLGGRKQ